MGKFLRRSVYLALAACSGADGADGATTLIVVIDEAPGEHCAAGGKAILTGVDADGDGNLSEDEVEDIAYVCSPEDGPDPLIRVELEPPGDNCEDGGQAISHGYDDNGNGTLDDDEIDVTQYVCASDPEITLVSVEPATTDECEDGGSVIHTGLDEDGDLYLSESEWDQSFYVCGAATLVSTEPAGDACALGGTAIHTGVDDDGDDVLDDDEIDTTSFVCDDAIIGDTLYGDYTIRNSLDAALLAGVTTITGTLTIEGKIGSVTTFPDVALPDLVTVGVSLVLSGETDASFPALDSVGTLRFDEFVAEVDLPQLANATRVESALSELDTLDLSALTGSLTLGFITTSVRTLTIGATVMSGTFSNCSFETSAWITAAGWGSVAVGSSNVFETLTIVGPSVFPGIIEVRNNNVGEAIDIGVTAASTVLVEHNSAAGGPWGLRMDAIDGTLPELQVERNDGLGYVSFASVDAIDELLVADNYELGTCHLDALPPADSSQVEDSVPCHTIGWCRLQDPVTLTSGIFSTPLFTGRVFVAGLTDVTGNLDAAPTVAGAVGGGPVDTVPSSAGWRWTWVGGLGGASDEPAVDEHATMWTLDEVGSFDTAFRFTGDGGKTWTYCDTGAAGSQDGYQIANAGSLTVTP